VDEVIFPVFGSTMTSGAVPRTFDTTMTA